MFKVGDKVRIVNALSGYSITHNGSEGVIEFIDTVYNEAKVRFYKITSDKQQYVGQTFDISFGCLEHCVEIPIEQQVINKIASIYSRQKVRTNAHYF